jgi:hypothetical protein
VQNPPDNNAGLMLGQELDRRHFLERAIQSFLRNFAATTSLGYRLRYAIQHRESSEFASKSIVMNE